jgi:hypothetical protein
MGYNFGTISFVHLHAVEETLRYLEQHGEKTTYDGLVKHLSWYWMDHQNEKEYKPQEWMFEWIKCLSGEN